MNILIVIMLLNAQNEIEGGAALGAAPNLQTCEGRVASWVEDHPAPAGKRYEHACIKAAETP